jgi:hypothetical protein
MKSTLSLAVVAAVAVAAMSSQASAYPAIYDMTLPGVSPQNFNLVINTGTDSILSFTVQGVSAPAGFTSTVTLANNDASAYYTAQATIPQAGGGDLNYYFGLDLEALNTPWPSPSGGNNLAADAVALLTNTTQLTTNLDTAANDPTQTLGIDFSNSTYTMLVHEDNGTVVAGSTTPINLPTPASGSPLNVAVPEPASLALLVTSLLGFAAVRRRRFF